MQLPQPIAQPYDARALITGFYQSGAGNCASIAGIKAALMAFGVVPVFAQVGIREGAYEVVMRDEPTVFRFSADELAKAGDAMSIKGNDDLLLEHAKFMFTAMVKRSQLKGNDGHTNLTFDEAILHLNRGEGYLEGPKWLGLKAYMKHGPDTWVPYVNKARRWARRRKAAIYKSPKHAWFGSYGLCDRYEKPAKPYSTASGAVSLEVNEG